MYQLDKSINFMLVDDDEIDIKDMQRTFKKNNIDNPLHVATNGIDALNKLLGINGEKKIKPTPKIILLDINMPKMNGIEFMKNLRTNKKLKSLLVFILTTSNSEKDKIDAYNLNAAGYIVKPFQISDFMEVITSLHHYWNLLEFPNKKAE
ncbi:response regulator [Fluoribacter gormanii]|uniref:CheY chemotaxis protein or a CheY-like REC (Receiver) domain n=1 Tax=Fluoribacter gormanii TaxID=464 RepID=A0A377GPR7_9GAMM|nr:response regulator [Fluoribacter gormanii]KTD04689.1 two-component response regulator [Fluoribacter gormanii]MCW8445325.1 response regulator [Fluoribacter gormanii]MCW8470530.1 response regulator [Fluoribacter gormanii]SIR12982.1 CheY chemotaxis protein or a CheY-like REC (receiver) domain [Fluoribacter gormanii]STO26312.1 Response regulator rcp1 [Fluoribacter gormanii]